VYLFLRTLADALAIQERVKAGAKQAVVLGGGLLGLEAAYSLRCLGLEVIVVETADRLLPKQLDVDGAAILLSILQKWD